MTTLWDATDAVAAPPATSDLADRPFRPTRPGERGEVDRLLAAGYVRPVLADVVVAAHRPDSRTVRAEAAGILLPRPVQDGAPGCALGFTAALWVHTGWTPEGTSPVPVDLIVPPGRHRVSSPVLRRRQIALTGADVVRIAGVPVTGAVRTAADVARELPAEQVRDALVRLRRATAVEPPDVVARLMAMRSVRGVRTALQLAREWAQEC